MVSARAARAATRLSAISLVDGDRVRQFHHAFLDALQPVTGAGDEQQQEEVHHGARSNFALTRADRLQQHDIVPGGLAEQDALARFARHTAGSAGGR